jgi:hypothetical protein
MEPFVELVGGAGVVINKHCCFIDVQPELGRIAELHAVGKSIQSVKKDGGREYAASWAACGSLAGAVDWGLFGI